MIRVGNDEASEDARTPPKNSSSSSSVISNAKLPTKAVNGGSVGNGRSSRMGAARSASECSGLLAESRNEIITHDGMRGNRLGGDHPSDHPRRPLQRLNEGVETVAVSHRD